MPRQAPCTCHSQISVTGIGSRRVSAISDLLGSCSSLRSTSTARPMIEPCQSLFKEDYGRFGWRRTRRQHDEPVQTESRPAEPALGTVERPELSVAAAARRLGVAPATLRTWDRRYGIGPSEHTPGRHRRYSPADVARLELMQHALVRGASPADAARFATAVRCPARGRPPPALPALAGQPPCRVPRTPSGWAAPRCRCPPPRAGRTAWPGPPDVGSGAGATLLTESVAAIGIEATWDDVVRPVLAAVAERWRHTGTGVEIEHQLSECVAGLFGLPRAAPVTGRGARPVLLAGMPGEQHMLPIIALSAALADAGVPCRTLGANLPVAAARGRRAPDRPVGRRAVGPAGRDRRCRGAARCRAPGRGSAPSPPARAGRIWRSRRDRVVGLAGRRRGRDRRRGAAVTVAVTRMATRPGSRAGSPSDAANDSIG